MMFRDPWEAAAEDVLVKATEQANLFGDAARYLAAHNHPRTAAICSEMADRRQDLASSLEAGLRALGVYPKTVDPEREALDRLFDTVRSALSEDEADSLLHGRLTADQALRDALAEAQAVDDMPGTLKPVFVQFAASLQDDDCRIAAFLASRRKAN